MSGGFFRVIASLGIIISISAALALINSADLGSEPDCLRFFSFFVLKGTSAEQDTRFSNKQAKLMKSQKFAPELEHLVDMTKVKMDVMKPWIANRVTELLGFEDEVLINFIYGLLDTKAVNGKAVQIQLTGFMEKNTGKFMKELWSLLISAQKNASGVPQQLLDAKEEETRQKQAERDRITAEIQKKKEKENIDSELMRQRKMDGGAETKANNTSVDPRSKQIQLKGSSGAFDNEKEAEIRNGSRGRSRVSKSPHRGDLSPSSPSGRIKPRSFSRSPYARHRSVSSERRRKRSVTPGREHSPRASNSPLRRRSSFVRQRSRSPSISRSPSPVRRRLRSPYRRRSPSPIRRRRSPSPVRRPRSPSPPRRRRRSRSPMRRRRSPSPIRQRRSPARSRRTPSPTRRRRSPSPQSRQSPSPLHNRSPSPLKRRSPSPPRRRYERSPPSSKRGSRSPARRRSRSPARRRSRSPARRRSRSPARRRSPAPTRQRSPVRTRQRSPSPFVSRSPSPIRQRSTGQSSQGKLRSREISSPVQAQSGQLRSPLGDAKERKDWRKRSPAPLSSPEASPVQSESPPPIKKTSNNNDKSIPRQMMELHPEHNLSPPPQPKDKRSRYESSDDSKEGEGNNRSRLKDSLVEVQYKGKQSPEINSGHQTKSRSHYMTEPGKKDQETRSEKSYGRKGHAKAWEGQKSPVESLADVQKSVGSLSHGHFMKDDRHGKPDTITSIENVENSNGGSRLDSDSDRSGKHEGKEKRKHKRSHRHGKSSSDDESDSEVEERKEVKKRRKEEKKSRKEEKRRRREERHRKRGERQAEKLKLKKRDDDSSDDDHAARGKMYSSSDDEEEHSEQKKLEIELRKKALESLKAKKSIDH
ncbi:unnamed protein product [Linum tenue]|uniref:PWI domain-containing protein n=1 Tax=Linum tenue TaxID=586396 RepID=A0AAV0I5Y2_9ROSI|nr:unnamed protein product [Linum tenue]